MSIRTFFLRVISDLFGKSNHFGAGTTPPSKATPSIPETNALAAPPEESATPSSRSASAAQSSVTLSPDRGPRPLQTPRVPRAPRVPQTSGRSPSVKLSSNPPAPVPPAPRPQPHHVQEETFGDYYDLQRRRYNPQVHPVSTPLIDDYVPPAPLPTRHNYSAYTPSEAISEAPTSTPASYTPEPSPSPAPPPPAPAPAYSCYSPPPPAESPVDSSSSYPSDN